MGTEHTRRKTLRDYFPAEVEGIGSFETLTSFLRYCNVSNSSARTVHEQHSEQWIEELVNKDTGPYYLEDVEYRNKTQVAKVLGLTTKNLTTKCKQGKFSNTQEYLDHLESNKLKYEGTVVYNPQTLSEATGLGVMTCSGILRRLKDYEDIQERQSKLYSIVNNRRYVVQIVKQLDPTVDNVTDFTKKYNMPRKTLVDIEETNATYEQIKDKLKKYVKAI